MLVQYIEASTYLSKLLRETLYKERDTFSQFCIMEFYCMQYRIDEYVFFNKFVTEL